MPSGIRKFYLLAYDIADPKRLVRVHRRVRQWGVPLQYSVFVVYTSSVGLGVLLVQLEAIIDRKRDDIRIYPLPRRLEMTHYGRQVLPEGVEIVGGRFAGETMAGLVQAIQED